MCSLAVATASLTPAQLLTPCVLHCTIHSTSTTCVSPPVMCSAACASRLCCLQFDVMAGLAVAFTVVPQGMSYANITGVPAVMGLYGAFLPVLIYALFGSCRQLGVGPVAVTSGLIFSGMAGIVPGYDEIPDPNDPKPEQVAIQVRRMGCPATRITAECWLLSCLAEDACNIWVAVSVSSSHAPV
jgi:MFS superfamily sulfate permease-like transporter